MIDPPFRRYEYTPDAVPEREQVLLLRIKEYINSGISGGYEVARCVRTSIANKNGTDDGSENVFVIISSHLEANSTFVAVRVEPDTGYQTSSGFRLIWQQMASAGSTLPTGSLYQVLTVIDETGNFIPDYVRFKS